MTGVTDMAEFIDRIAFRKHIDDFYPFDKKGQKDLKYDFAKGTFLRLLACFTQADVVERKVGRWISHIEDGYLECPFCGAATNCDGDESELHFCFSCGAKMEVPTDV